MTTENRYDVVIVGAGVAGAMIAKQLGLAGKKVLILEAGAGIPPNINDFMERFYTASAKVPEIPYTPALFDKNGLVDPGTLNAARPTVLTLGADNWNKPDQAYLVQNGPKPFGSNYERIAGGTVRHWLGTSLRFVPHDFEMQTTYGRLVNWPLSYNDLEPWYGRAEAEIGVSADVDEQEYLDIHFPEGYQYPMPHIPSSVLDDTVASGVEGLSVDGIPLSVANTPAGRNSEPRSHKRLTWDGADGIDCDRLWSFALPS